MNIHFVFTPFIQWLQDLFLSVFIQKKERRNFLTERRQSLCNISTLFMMVIAWRRRSTDLNEHSWRSDEKRTDPDKNGYKLRMFHRAKWSGLQRIQNRNESVDEKREINDMIVLPIQNLELKKTMKEFRAVNLFWWLMK